MAYTEAGVINLALQRLGIPRITSGDWASPSTEQALAANAVWQYIRDEVLEAADWRFAKSRTTLSKVPPRVDLDCGDGKHLYVEADRWLEDTLDISIEIYTNTVDTLSITEDPSDSQNILVLLANSTTSKNTAALIQTGIRALTTVNGISVAAWTATGNAEFDADPPTLGVDLDEVNMAASAPESFQYAYIMPTDFLKLAANTENDRNIDPAGGYGTVFDQTTGTVRIRGILYNYVIESLPDDRLVLLIDYNATEDDPLELVYIRAVSDVTKWTAHFISAAAFRLAAELAFPLTESDKKYDRMFGLYEKALSMARALNQGTDFVEDETGSTDWEYAGR